MAVEVFHGSWQIVEIVNISNFRNNVPTAAHGAVFVLKENGDIDWILGPDIDRAFPLFQCNCYEVVHTFVGVCIQLGALSGHVFEFWVDRPVPRDMMLLTFEGWCMLQCHQIPTNKPPLDFPFSLLPALTDAYFSDMILPLKKMAGSEDTVKAATDATESPLDVFPYSREFKVHSLIMDFTDCDLKLISRLSPDVLEVVLHYLYSQSLPLSLSEDLARRCINQVPKTMSAFVTLCEDYIRRIVIKNKIVKLVNEVHARAEAMAVAFQDHSVISKTRFGHVTKEALRDGGVAFLKLVELCVVYGEESPSLDRNESVEILRYAKTRLPIFLNQFVALLRNIKNDFSTVKTADRNDIAAHVAPQIETLLEALSNLTQEGRLACTNIWSKWSTSGSNKTTSTPTPETPASTTVGMDSLSEALFAIFRKREVIKLHQLQAQLSAMHLYLHQKQENFEEMSTEVKVRCVSRNLEQLIEELPVFLLRLEEIMMAFDDRFQWKDFKFCLQLAISQVCQTVQHLRKEKDELKKFLMSLSELVHRDEFHQSLVNLGLIDVQQGDESSCSSAMTNNSSASDASDNLASGLNENMAGMDAISKPATSAKPLTTADFTSKPNCGFSAIFPTRDLNLFENLCTPQVSRNSFLAKSAKVLFESKIGSDMVFEIVQDGEPVEIPAHRTIVAARCDWIRRALLSGMKESIQKRIIIHDCSVSVFQLFLCFIYTGQMTTDVTLETLSELIALADRYEMDILKLYCEQELTVRHLDEASVIFLLSMADQYNARTLRSASIEYITANPGIMGKEMFEELSPELQMEVYDITMWSKPKKVYSIPEELFNCPRYLLVPDSPSDDDSSPGSPPPPSAPTI